MERIKDRTSELKERTIKITHLNNKEKQTEKYEQSLKELWDYNKRLNIRVTGVPGQEKEDGTGNVLKEVMVKNSPSLVKYINLQIPETEHTPNRIEPKKSMPIHNIQSS